MAGLDGDLFADKYRNELAGMVLVDPATAHQTEMFNAIPGVKEQLSRLMPNFAECTHVAKSGKLPTDNKLIQDCLDRDPQDDALARSVKDQWDMNVLHWTTLQSEMQSMNPATAGGDRDSADIDLVKRNWGNLPLIVLTSSVKHFAGFPPSQAKAMEHAWVEMHDKLADRSTKGRNIEVPDSGHYIQLDHPAIVIQAIKDIVGTVKSGT
jgi:pimeloyl-ACP methyl ester carboxylesterase